MTMRAALAFCAFALANSVDAANVALHLSPQSTSVSSQVSYLGYDTFTVSADGGNKSDTVTVPTGSDFALIGFNYFKYASSNTVSAVTLDGQSATQLLESTYSNNNRGKVYRVSGFTDGTDVTLAFTQDAMTPDGEGSVVLALFFSAQHYS